MQVLLLAFEAALYPTLLAAVVILLAQPRPKRLLAAYLAGGLTISISLGLVIVFALKGSHAVTGGRSGLSWASDLAVGGLALLLAVALAVRADQRVSERRARRRLAAGKGPKPQSGSQAGSSEPWSERILARGSVPIVFAAALAINLPGAAYLIALKDIAKDGHSPLTEVILIVLFNLIMFALAEIPLAGLMTKPERTAELVGRANAWLSGHGRDIAVALSAVLGVYLIARGIAKA
jgi:Sap, sulfolipid-1-addressing protein